MTQPQILTLNLDQDVAAHLKAKNYTVWEGSVGNLIKLNIRYDSYVNCILQHRFPQNFHEYDIVIIDLTTEEETDYNEKDHKISFNKTSSEYGIRCHYPQTIFDPRAFSLGIIAPKIEEMLKRPFLLLVFAAAHEEIDYNFVSSSSYDENTIKKSNYGFTPFMPIDKNKHGLKTVIPNGENDLYNLLRKYQAGLSYDITFYHPTIFKEGKSVKDPNFYPLVYNNQEDIVGFVRPFNTGSYLFTFPQVKEKAAFLESFLQEVAPAYTPAIFPDNIKNSWTKDANYYLPNQARLIAKKETLHKNFQEALENLEKEITQNNDDYGWLHEMLTETDNKLVSAVIKFLDWLGFNDVKDGDEINQNSVKEEDIQIETAEGLIILEVKGIGGTSKDSDCSQIGKIKARRAKQRGKFDVFGTYIVNHQRHLPPHERKNPPFTAHQMSDALYDERGLMTTWQLFILYHLIEKGVLTKDQAKAQFYRYGFIDFIPPTYISLGTPKEFFKNNTVVILTLPEGTSLAQNEDIFVVHNEVYQKVNIKSIQVNEETVALATGVEVGLQLSNSIAKSATLYKIT